MVAPLVVAAVAEGGAVAGAAGAAGAGAAGAGAASAGAAGAGAAGAGGAASAAGAESATAARANLFAERHAAKQAAAGGPNFPSSAPANAQVQQAEGALDQSGQWRAQEQRLKMARDRMQDGNFDFDEDTLDFAQDTNDEEEGEDTVEQPPQEDPVTRLHRKAESMMIQAADNDMVSHRMSDAVTAAIQALGSTSLTFVDFCLGMIVAFPLTIIQFLITFGIIQQPAPGTKMKLIYDWMNYHVWSETGLFKLQGGCFILSMGFVGITMLIVIIAAIFVPVFMGTETLSNYLKGGNGSANQSQQAQQELSQ